MEPESRQSPRLFISYASADKAVARRIATQLKARGAFVWFDEFELNVGDSLRSKIEHGLSSSDYLVVLLSRNAVESSWVQSELSAALSVELTTRDITILPLLVEDCDIPVLLRSRLYLDLRHDFDAGIDRLAKQLGLASDIDFAQLEWGDFENLIVDLLEKRGFTKIERDVRIDGMQIDVRACFEQNDPFGVQFEETWLVEIKLYKNERPTAKSIAELAHRLASLSQVSKGLIVTNSHLTSAAKEMLNSLREKQRIELRVIDGTELRRLILANSDLIENYFGDR